MGLFDGYAKRMVAPGKGTQDPVPQKGAKRVFYVFVNHFWKIAFANLLFFIFCIPVVTAPAAVCGLAKVMHCLFYEGTADVFKDFFQEFKGSFVKSLLPGLIGAVGLGGGGFAVVFYVGNIEMTIGAVGGVFAAAIVIWVWVFLNHLFYQLAVIDLPLKTLMKNARILSIGQAKANLLLILVSGGLIILTSLLLPYSLAAFVLIVPAFCQLCACAILYDSIGLCISQ